MSSKKGKNNVNYDYHGSILAAEEIIEMINHIHDSNLEVIASGSNAKTPICIWGKHGIGKTSIPKQIALIDRKIGFKSIAPAQFEEMGDLLGMPGTGVWVIKDGQGKLVDKDVVESYLAEGWERDRSKPNQTITAAPEWVPNPDLGDPEEGFFLIDDFNRAGKRIINGIMQLLQDGGLASWSLPPKWTIILTANPGGGLYQVTELDDAQLTRITHMSMEFQEKMWAKWALQNDIDGRIVNFVLKHPELIRTGEKTTARSMVYFANNIKSISDLKKDLNKVQILGKGSLDNNTATVFTTFINDNLTKLISPQEILDAKNFKLTVEDGVVKPFASGSAPRVDVLSILATRLIFHCSDALDGKLKDKQLANLKAFINIKEIPNDIRLNMAQELIASGKQGLKKIMTDPTIGKLLLKRM